MTLPILTSLFASVFLASASGEAVDKNLLTNPGMEKGGRTSVTGWTTIWPPTLAAGSPPTFETSDEDPPEGKRAATIRVEYQGGYTSYTQEVRLPRKTRSVRFTGAARLHRPTETGGACLLITFVSDDPELSAIHRSVRLTDETDWTDLEVSVNVPDGVDRMLARCGVYGPCEASFDDCVLTASRDEVRAGQVRTAIIDATAVAKSDAEAPWVRVSVPPPIGGQTPLGIRVTSEPEDAVQALAVAPDRENRALEVRLAPMAKGDEVALRVETWTLLHDRDLSDGRGVELAPAKRMPKEVKAYLDGAPGVDVEAPEVVAAASAAEIDDLPAARTTVAEILSQAMSYSGGGDQGSVHCLKTGKGVCTGYANAAAAMLNARGVPTRILACIFPDTRLQEHYIVEAWTPELGWSRMETTGGQFPYPDSSAVILRVVYPDSPRSVGHVPLYKDASEGVECRFRMDENFCFQGGETITPFAFDAETLEALESKGRSAFEALEKTPAEGSRWRAFDDAGRAPEAARDLIESLDAWLAATGEVVD
ncbi:MAG: transglutaminase domain-containing protein [Planctomycetota bacterium]